jgi:hypothetical protein
LMYRWAEEHLSAPTRAGVLERLRSERDG